MPLDIYAGARRELTDYVANQPAVGPFTPVLHMGYQRDPNDGSVTSHPYVAPITAALDAAA